MRANPIPEDNSLILKLPSRITRNRVILSNNLFNNSNIGMMSIATEISNAIMLENVFAPEQLKLFRNIFTDAIGVTSLISYPDDLPITKPVNF